MTAQDIAREMKLIADAPGDPEADHMSGEDLLLSALRLATLEWPSFEQDRRRLRASPAEVVVRVTGHSEARLQPGPISTPRQGGRT